MAFPDRQPDVYLDKEFPEDFEGVDIDGGFGVEFDVAEDFLGDFVADLAVERDEHGFGKGQGHEFLDYRVVVTDKRHEILGFRAEAESNRKLEEEADMEIAEIGLDRIQHEDVPFTPFEEALF